MRKEIFIAIVFGFIIGIVIVFGVITARSALHTRQGNSPDQDNSSTVSPTPSPAPDLSISITEPGDGAVVDSDKLTLRGMSVPKSTIVISGEKGDMITAADDSGSYTQDVPLVSGANEIRAVSFTPSGERSEATITVVFSTADF